VEVIKLLILTVVVNVGDAGFGVGCGYNPKKIEQPWIKGEVRFTVGKI
jgi:hypothetical protein